MLVIISDLYNIIINIISELIVRCKYSLFEDSGNG